MLLIDTTTVLDAIVLLGLKTGGASVDDCVGCELSAIG
jgi:hypothetical protein